MIGFLFGLTFVLWLPFGLNISDWADGWVNFWDVEKGVFVIWGSSRPFVLIPTWLGYILDPNSFSGVNLVQLMLLLLTGLLLYLILRQINVPQVAAAAAGALAIIYPADNITFYLGAIAIHFAVVCYLLGVYLLITYRRTHRWWLVLLMWFSLALSVGTYEVGYPLILITPIILLILRPSLRQFIIASALWYLVPVVNLVFLFIKSRQDASLFGYQSSLLVSIPSLGEMFQSLLNAYKTTLYTGWSINQGLTSTADMVLGVAVGIITLVAFSWLAVRTNDSVAPKQIRLYMIILGLGGLASLGLGFAAYLPTALRNSPSRTLYYSSVGGAVCVMVGLWLLSNILPLKRLVFPLLVGVFVGLGTFRLLDQHAQWVALPNRQNTVLLETLKHVPNIKPGSALIVIDDSPDDYLKANFPSSFYFKPGIQLALKDFSVQAGICYPKMTDPWGGAFQEHCAFENDRVVISEFQQPFLESDYSHLIVLHFTADHQIELQPDLSAYTQNSAALTAYHPEKLIDVNGTLPLSANTLLPIISLPN